MAHVIRISYKPQYQPRFHYSEEEEARYDLMIKEAEKRSGQRLTLGTRSGIPVDSSLAPRTARQTSDHKKLYDLVPTRNGWLLSRRAMELIESMAHRAVWTDRRFKEVFVSDLFWNELQKLGIKEIESELPAPEV
jgi:hypothetical protein